MTEQQKTLVWASRWHQQYRPHLPMLETKETLVRCLGQEDPLGAGMATHSSILAWRMPMHRGVWWATVHGVASDLAHAQAGAGQAGEKVGLEFREEA